MDMIAMINFVETDILKESVTNRILITGGSSGIGAAIAEKFHKEKWKVFIADRDEPRATFNENYFFCKTDVTRAEDIGDLYQSAKENIGIPDVLVINAGRGIREKLLEGDPEKWQQVIDTNLMGALRCIRAFVPEMLERKSGNVVFISSVAANQPHEYGGIYSASKTALEVIAETLRLETLPHLNVTVVSLGITETNFFKNEISGHTSIEKLNMGSIEPEEVAEDVFYAVNKKKNTSINKIITRPLKQNF